MYYIEYDEENRKYMLFKDGVLILTGPLCEIIDYCLDNLSDDEWNQLFVEDEEGGD